MIKLDANSWDDCEWWYEDEPDVFEFMRENEDKIRNYALKYGLTIKQSIDICYNLRMNK